MQEKLFSALKQAYPQLGLSDEILRHHSKMLVAALQVTDENLAKIVEMQKDFLQGLQVENDKRTTSALAKAKVTAENERQAAIDEAVKTALEAERKRVSDEAKKAEEEKRKEEQAKEEPEFMTKFRKELEEKERANAERESALTKKLEAVLKANEAQGKTLSELQKENEAMKAEAAKTARKNLISNIAKELNIPQWRADEGFVIAEDADEASIRESLNKVANNIKVNTMQGNGSFVIDGNTKVTEEEAKAIVNEIMK